MANSMSRRIVAVAAATTLALGVTACSEAEDAASKAGDAAASATSAAGDAAASATSAVGDAVSTSEAADGESVEVQTAGGNPVLVPGAFAQAVTDREGDWGQPVTVEEGENATFLAAFDNGNHLTYSEETGAVELVGEIGNTWIAEGGLSNPIGLPTDTESQVDGGWSQDFQNGTISWLDGGNGEFSATVEQA